MQRALQDLKKTAFNLDTRVKPGHFPAKPFSSLDSSSLLIYFNIKTEIEMLLILSSLEVFFFLIKNVDLKTPESCRGPFLMAMCCLLQTEMLVLRAERRALCDCMPTNSLRWKTPASVQPLLTPCPPPPTLKPLLTHHFSWSHLPTRHFIFFCLFSHVQMAHGRKCSGPLLYLWHFPSRLPVVVGVRTRLTVSHLSQIPWFRYITMEITVTFPMATLPCEH